MDSRAVAAVDTQEEAVEVEVAVDSVEEAVEGIPVEAAAAVV